MVIILTFVHMFVQRWWDKREGWVFDPNNIQTLAGAKTTEQDKKVPKIYAVLPIIPLFLIIFFSKVAGSHIRMDVVTAMVISTIIAIIFELIRLRNFRDVLASFKLFFEGMGKYFAVVVTLIVAGQVFGKGLTAIGAVNALIAGAESMGLGVMSLIIVMGVIIGIIAFLMGSGNAPFYSFASIAPAIAEKFGVHAADVLLPLQTMTGFGRTMSPVTGGIVAVAGMAGVSPFRVVKRNMVPLLCCCVVNFLVVYLFILP